MTARTRKKNSRLRGSHTHGWGSKKKHRGAGHRGGRGNAGSGKRADQKKPSYWNKEKPKGFFSITGTQHVTINVGHLNSIAEALERSGHAAHHGGTFTINLREMGYTKLLGAGKVTKKLAVSVAICTPDAKEKIEAAGGSVEAETVVDKEAVKAEREAKAKARRDAKRPPQRAAPAKTAE